MASKTGENWQSIERFPGERLKPPADLPAPAKKHFTDLVSSMSPSHFIASDMSLIKLWAFTAAVCEEIASNMLRSDGQTAASADVYFRVTKTLLMISRTLLIGPITRRRRQSKKQQPLPGPKPWESHD